MPIETPKWVLDIIEKTGWTVAKVMRTVEREKRRKQ
jgi:hypothetical protein